MKLVTSKVPLWYEQHYHHRKMILDPTNSQHIDFNDWLAQCPVQWFKLDSDDDQHSYQFIIDTSEEDEE